MFLDNFLHYGESEAGPARTRRHIGFGQPVTLFHRKADAVVSDGHKDARIFRDDRQTYLAAVRSMPGRNCLGGILQQICQIEDLIQIKFQKISIGI